jgi:hypothetical protein
MTTPFYDYVGQEFKIGQVVFFEFNMSYGAIPRKGRITKINPDKQKIKVLSNKDGGYCKGVESGVLCRTSMCHEPKAGKPGGHLITVNVWREFWIGMDNCPIIIGGPDKRLCEC